MKAVALLLIAGTNAITLHDDPVFSSLGYETRHYKGEGDYDDYTVPHFGTDTDVVGTLKNAADAEKAQGHFWDVLAPSPDDPKRNYFRARQAYRRAKVSQACGSYCAAKSLEAHEVGRGFKGGSNTKEYFNDRPHRRR